MKTHTILLAAISALALAFGAVACGSSEPLTLEEFMQELEALDNEYEERGNELNDSFDDEIADITEVDEAIDRSVQFFRDLSASLDSFVSGIEDLDAPEEAEQIQNNAVSAGRDALDAFDDLIAEAEEAETEAEFTAVTETADLQGVFAAFSAVCVEAQALADENDIDVSFNCNEG